MSYIEKIDKIIDNIDPGEAKFIIHLHDYSLRVGEERWTPEVEGDDFYETYVNRYARRHFLKREKKYVINREEAYQGISHRVLNLADQIFIQCSPAKAPRRTKLYKSFRTTLYDNKGKIDFVNSIFDIAEYYFSVTKTESIIDDTNDVHRKNIFHLLCLMEKNYGSKGKTSSN